MDKAYEQLKTQVFDLCHGGSSSDCESVFTVFEVKYKIFKGLFLSSREKHLKDNEKGRDGNIPSCERSLEKKEKGKENEHYVNTLSTNKLFTENLIGKKNDASPTS